MLSFLYSPTLTSIHPYMTTGKMLALTTQTFVGKVMSLLFNMLSRLVIAFLPRSKHLLISWLQSPSAVILEPPKIVWHCFHCFPICHEVMGPDVTILVFWMLLFCWVYVFSCWIYLFIIMWCSSMLFLTVFVLKVIFIWYENSYCSFLFISMCMKYIFSIPSLSVWVCPFF